MNSIENTNHNIMSIIDENKKNISDGDYLKLCDLLKKQNEEEEKNDNFYNVEYVYSRPVQLSDNHWDMMINSKNEILKMSYGEYKCIQDGLENMTLFPSNKLAYSNNCHSFEREISNCSCDDDCDECHEQSVSTCLRSQCYIISIKPA